MNYEPMEENCEALVLIVDDIQKNIQVLGNILSEENFDIAIAENGRKALEFVEKTKPDLILLDVMMPELDGHETCKILKSAPETKDIPVIFLTAKSDTEDIVKGFELGAVDYVTKPFNPTELISRVRTHLSLKMATDKERKYIKQLEELNKLKNEFLGMAVHDLRNPIGVIASTSNMMLEFLNENLTAKQIKFLTNINNTSMNMSRLVNDLLDITAIESGKLKLEFSRENYVDFIKNNVQFNQDLLEKKKILLELKIGDNIPEFSFDKNKMTQVMDNLISNAAKYSHPDTKVTIEVVKENNHIVTNVIDEGQGIPEKDLPNMFKAFHKASVKTTGGEKSTGLGLVIIKKIVEGHGGNVGVESKVGEGSKFYFTLSLSE